MTLLKLGHFISKKITKPSQGYFSSAVFRIAVISVAVGLATMIVAYAIMQGFRHTIENKLYDVGGHMLLTKITTSNDIAGEPFSFNMRLYRNPMSYASVTHVGAYAYEAGLIKTSNDALGILFKGVDHRFLQSPLANSVVEGNRLSFSDAVYDKEVMISVSIARKIRAHVGDDLMIHFFQTPPRFRKLRVVGIYETNLSEYFDSKVILGDLRLIQKLNQWSDSTATGLEMYVTDPTNIFEAYQAIEKDIPYNMYVATSHDRYGEVFDWLDVIGRQVYILLAIMMVVVCVNMISVVLVMSMERVRMIGILKAMGARNSLLRAIFLHSGIRLIVKGLVYGNGLAFLVAFVQYKFKVISLNPHDYYMDYVPIGWDWSAVLLLNLLMLLVVTSSLFLPLAVAVRLSPIKAMDFD